MITGFDHSENILIPPPLLQNRQSPISEKGCLHSLASVRFETPFSENRLSCGFWRGPGMRILNIQVEDPDHSSSNPWLVNLSVRAFSVTVRTTLSGTPEGTSASISSVTVTFAPTRPARWAMTSSAMRPASAPGRTGFRVTVPWKRAGCFVGGGVGPSMGGVSGRRPGGGVGPEPGGMSMSSVGLFFLHPSACGRHRP